MTISSPNPDLGRVAGALGQAVRISRSISAVNVSPFSDMSAADRAAAWGVSRTRVSLPPELTSLASASAARCEGVRASGFFGRAMSAVLLANDVKALLDERCGDDLGDHRIRGAGLGDNEPGAVVGMGCDEVGHGWLRQVVPPRRAAEGSEVADDGMSQLQAIKSGVGDGIVAVVEAGDPATLEGDLREDRIAMASRCRDANVGGGLGGVDCGGAVDADDWGSRAGLLDGGGEGRHVRVSVWCEMNVGQCAYLVKRKMQDNAKIIGECR